MTIEEMTEKLRAAEQRGDQNAIDYWSIKIADRKRLAVGWFSDARQATPAYDPGIDVPCPHCGDTLSADNVRTYSVMAHVGVRSVFYRVHRTCDDAASEEQVRELDRIAMQAARD